MKTRTSFLTRCLSLVMALVLLVSCSNLGFVLQASAATGSTVTAGELVANNYALTDAEKALLSSGYLAGGETIAYNIPDASDNLITVDADNNKITATEYEGWTSTTAEIVVDGETVETVALTGGEGTYAYDGNAFAVKVNYSLTKEVAGQQTLLDAMSGLKAGVANLSAGYNGSDTDLGTVAMALDTLVTLADGITMDMGWAQMSAKFGDEAAAAVYALDAQAAANGEKLNLQVKNAEYSAASKTQYLINSGAAYGAEVVSTYNYLNAINSDALLNNQMLDAYMQANDPASYTQWSAFKSILGKLVAALEPVAAASWNTENLVNSTVDYAALDTLVAALGDLTAVEVKNPLTVAATTIQANMSMFNVTVTVELKTVEDKADSTELVSAGTKTAVVTVAEGADKAAILAAIEKNGIEAAAKAEWTDYVDGCFEATGSELPETLTEDTTYTITYAPKNYTVSYDYTTDAPTSVPYGYQLTLPVHADAAQAYDYTVNGADEVQGAVITITGDTSISRSAGKAYTNTDLYTIIADNNGNEVADGILKSGALKNNVSISVRKPDPADSESLLKLESDKLTAVGDYDAAYEELSWAPYTYGAEGTENAFNGSDVVDWTEMSVKVKYILNLTNLEDDAAAAQALVATLKDEAAAQVETLDKLAAYYDTMGQLDKTKLGALNGVIDVTDFTPDDGTDTDEANKEMQAYFKGLVSGIIANNLDSNNYLKIYNMLGGYLDETTGGLTYYYANSEAVINEINVLSGYLSGMLADEEKEAALKIMVEAAGYPEYADKIADLEGIMAEVKAALTAPNAAIDLTSDTLYKLIDALEAEGEVAFTGETCPYLVSETLSATDDSTVMVQLFVEAGGKSETFTTPAYDRGTVLSQEAVDTLIASAKAYAAEQLGSKVAYYEVSFDELNALVRTELNQKVTNIYTAYTAIEYTVAIEGVEGTKTITIENTKITLPAHATAGWVYDYVVFDKTYTVTQTAQDINLTAENLAQFGDGIYTITRTERNKAQEDLEDKVESASVLELVKDANGNITAIVANVDSSKSSLMQFANELTGLGYTYIELNDRVLLEVTDKTTVSLQTLMDAILEDNTFGSQTLIDLNTNNGGKVFSGIMDLGNGANDIAFEGLTFTFNLTSVPAQMNTVATGLNTVKDYMTFQSQDGVMSVNFNLPEKVYEVYLTALLATDNVDKTDMNAVNAEIAYMFLYDYLEQVLATDANTTTYTNTLKNLGQDYDLTDYEEYYQMVKSALTSDGVVVNSVEDDETFDVAVTATGKTAIDKIFGLIGLDPSGFSMELAMVKEYQNGEKLSAAAVATLGNVPTSYEALILDVSATADSTVKTAAKKFDYTNDLPARVGSIANQAAVILLADVDGDLNFPGTTVLDLNGYAVNGSINAAGDLLIVDSCLGTTSAGAVTDEVSASGNVYITGGKFNADVTAYLKDGYKQVDGYVQNVLYTIESTEDTATIILNSDYLSDVEGYLPNVKTMAVDIAVDVALNYFTAAAMSVDGNNIYTINYDELINLLLNEGKIDGILDRSVDSLNHEGITAFANEIIADLLDFAALADAIENNTTVASYNVATNPWMIEVQHILPEDHIDFALTANPESEDALTIALKVDGNNAQKLVSRLDEFAEIVTTKNITVALDDPDYIRDTNTVNVSGNAKAEIVIDLTKNREYLNVMAVYMATVSDDETKADLVNAVENNYYDIIKGCFDSTTANKIFTGLKDLSRNKSFEELASEMGFTLSDEAKRIGNLYHILMCGAGKALEVLEISGPNAEMAGLVEDGTYTLNRTFKRSGEPSYKGYTVNYDVTSVDVSLTVKVFAPTIIRVYGKDRTLSALEIAEKMKDTMNVEKFNAIVLACGKDFPDALSGSYLAIKEEAPILLYGAKYMNETVKYISENLEAGGMVYILGGTAAVPQEMEDALVAKNITCKRVKGATRWETNLAILNEAVVGTAEEIVVASGKNYADVMTASATGMPILIVNTDTNKLTAGQIAYLENHKSNKITIFGGTGAVSQELEDAIEAIVGTEIERVKGATREETSTVAAEKYYDAPDTAVVAYSRNFPDGLCGGPLAYSMGAPLLLVNEGESQYKYAADYVDEKDVTIGYVLGGEAAVSDETAKAVFNDADIIRHRYPLD